jgi:hypothetical protein
MKGLTSIERNILETVHNKKATYDQIQEESGIIENVCFNVLQSLVERKVLKTDGVFYFVSPEISKDFFIKINSQEALMAERLEYIEAILERKDTNSFKFKKFFMDERDEKIFNAMLFNLESFIKESHSKFDKKTFNKDHKVIFWGMGDVKTLTAQMIAG